MTQTIHVRFAALLTAGFLASTAGIAYADTTTSGNGSIGGGNQVEADIDAPINVCGNAIAVLGLAGADCTDGEASVTGASSTSAPRDSDEDPGGYDGYYPEYPEYPEEPEEPVEEEPEEPVEEEPPEDKEREEQAEEEPSEAPSESASPSAPPADEHRLAVTGDDQGALTGLVAAAILTVAAGAGLLLFGRRRKSES
ncbi:chaplin family protein [Nocardiopsis nanhaiensis]